MENKELQKNTLICDPETGMCELPSETKTTDIKTAVTSFDKPVRLIYYTDPICSACWAIEPQLRKLKLEYGHVIDFEYRMGGLLPDWSYSGGGISKPSDVAHHWDEVSVYYDMPIDGDIWLEDPLNSSYPPSIAFKAAQLQDKERAIDFLRKLREMVFLQKRNIARWEVIELAALQTGLDTGKLKTDAERSARILFEEDLKMAREYGVRGFPTLFFTQNGKTIEIVYGSRPYEIFENALSKLYPEASKSGYNKELNALFSVFGTLTAREFSELSGTPRKESEVVLDELVAKGELTRISTKNGSMWQR